MKTNNQARIKTIIHNFITGLKKKDLQRFINIFLFSRYRMARRLKSHLSSRSASER